jgi:hypothetical protein
MVSALKDQEEVGGDAERQTLPKGVAGAAERKLMLKVDSVAVQVGWDAPAPVTGLRRLVMPRYYIDVRSHFATNEDPDGIELPDVAAARAEALKMGAKLLDDWARLPSAYSSAIVIEIVDEDLHPVLAIPYMDIAVQKPLMS